MPTLAAATRSSAAPRPGIGFAIPSNTSRTSPARSSRTARSSTRTAPTSASQAANTTGDQGAPQGVLVYAVEDGGPAAKAGIKQGDLIVSIDGKPVGDTNQLSMVLATLEPGKAVPVVVQKDDGTQTTVQVTLGQIPG